MSLLQRSPEWCVLLVGMVVLVGACTSAEIKESEAGAVSTFASVTSRPDPPSSEAVEVRTVTLRVDPPTVADREDLDVWSDPNDAVALDMAPDGSIWTTGPGGTTRWDVAGGSATVFTVDHGLGSNDGRALSVSPNGVVFVANGSRFSERGDGISVFDGESWSHQTTANGLPSDSVLDLEIAADGTIWAASYAGLAYYGDETWHIAEGSPATFDLALGSTGELRAQTEDGVVVVDNQTQWRDLPSEPLPGWEALPSEGSVVDRNGGWWFPLWGVGMVHSTPDGIEVHVIEQYLEEYRQAAESGDIARAVLLPGLESVFGTTVTSDGEVWALGAPGILRLSNGGWLRVEGEGLSDATLNDVRTDGNGGHWLATDRGAVHVGHDRLATSFVLPSTVGNLTNHVAVGPAGVFASSIFRQARTETVTVSHLDGEAWAAAAAVELTRIEPSAEPDHFGLDQNGYPVVFRGTAYRVLDGSDWVEPTAPYERALTHPTVDGNGTLWADAGDAVWYLTNGEWRVVEDDRQRPGGEGFHITGFAPRPEGGVWLATWDQGVFVADMNGISEVPAAALDFRRMTTMVAGRDGSVWVAGNSEAGTELAHWDGSRWTLVPVPPWDGAFDWVTCMAVGPDGAVWIGDGHETSPGFGSGVAKFLDDTWTRYGSDAGLPSTDVHSIAVGDDGALWVGTDAGVARISHRASPIDDLDSGLFCRDLVASGLGYSDAVTYWVREGEPHRMDADRNGIPCETVYPRADIVDFWGEPLPTTTTTAVVYSIATHGDMPDPLPGSDGYFGSGCIPGSDTLPDGIWFGFVRDLSETAIVFDLACLRWIDDPNDDAIEEGGWDLSNTNPKIRNVPVANGAQATCPWTNCPQPWMAYPDWMQRTRDVLDTNPDATEWAQGHDFGVMVWLYVNGGSITEIVEPVLAG